MCLSAPFGTGLSGTRSLRSCRRSIAISAGGGAGVELAAHDQIAHVLDIGFADQPLGDVTTFIHDLDAVAHEEQILEAVSDQNDADAASAHGADQVQHSLDLGD